MSSLSRVRGGTAWASDTIGGAEAAVGGRPRRILVPIDGRAVGPRALGAALDLARREGAEITLLHVVDLGLTHISEAGIPPSDLLTSLRREGQALLRQAGRTLPADLRVTEVLREGRPADEILAEARDRGADLIVLGRTGHTGLGRFLSSGTAEAIVRRAPCPVLVVRPHAQPETAQTWGWRRLVRWARLKDEAGCTDRVPA